MLYKHPIKNSPKLAVDGKELHQLVIELNEQRQEMISGGTAVSSLSPTNSFVANPFPCWVPESIGGC
ncbi:hypothetical protein H6F98_13715 [Microcoleus sp. FACHB-SPT15]|uniref:hypothetical protein n=1 Tax=Microcoleus sp. FACHB-SPT15 TaxID=2692830 RepID=UPI00178706C7|nr:hypothetical protein [Microcoleus sp. FACHB-SPT15]MBD1806503.1 hypothetical protein [Microcoleus sp. FACHB-SPT15]